MSMPPIREYTMSKTVHLTDRERQLLQGVLRDLTYAEIAQELDLTAQTVKTYFKRLRAKLGCSSKVGLANYANRRRDLHVVSA